MYGKTIVGIPRHRALGGVAAVALVAAIAVLFVARAASRSAIEAATARERLQNNREAAERYSALSATMMKPSADFVEARSNEFLSAELGKLGLPRDGISYDDPEETPDGRQTLKINIHCAKAPFSPTLDFLHRVETARRNLALLSLDMNREKAAVDSWDVNIAYGAVILRQAKSGS